jgi:hypothetical protein
MEGLRGGGDESKPAATAPPPPQELGRRPSGQPLTAREPQEAGRGAGAYSGQAGVATMGEGALSAGGGRAGRIRRAAKWG